MTMEKWNEWLKWLDNQLAEKSLLLIGSCPAHTDGSSINLKNLQVEFLPPNTTSHIQPCDPVLFEISKLIIEPFWHRNGFMTWIMKKR